MEEIILSTVSLNQKNYTLPGVPVVVICADGWANEYISLGFAHGELPNLARLASDGYYGLARGALPSFTNVNNCSIVTGTPPFETGIGGNYIIDPESGEELMTNSSRFLRNDTILAAASQAGRKVAMVTAKDKLRELLSKGMNGISISAEKADEVSIELNGIDNIESLVGPKPVIYSADASLYVLRVGVELLASGRADFLYLSLTDYMQHKYAPEASESREFYRLIDIAINPMVGGTGLKIKSLEALSYGKALLATEDAMVGINGTDSFHNFASVTDMVEALNELTLERTADLHRNSIALFLEGNVASRR